MKLDWRSSSVQEPTTKRLKCLSGSLFSLFLMLFHLDARMNFRKILVFFLSAMSHWSAWDISLWFPNMGKALLYILETFMMGPVSGYTQKAPVFLVHKTTIV